jgi:hypothetical protein
VVSFTLVYVAFYISFSFHHDINPAVKKRRGEIIASLLSKLPKKYSFSGVMPLLNSLKGASQSARFASGITIFATSSALVTNCINNPASVCQLK